MINNVVLMGRLTAAPELKTTGSGTSVTSFTIAVERGFKPKDGERETDFIPCVAWRNNAEFVTKYFGKGDMIAVTGEIQTRKYIDKNGNNRTAIEIVVSSSSFCGSKNNSGNNVPAASPYIPSTEPGYTSGSREDFMEVPGDDLPF